MMGIPWTKEELEALYRLVRLEKATMKYFREVFPNRTVEATRRKLSTLRAADPDKWTYYKPREIRWEVLEKLENSCEKSDCLETYMLEVDTV